MTSYRLLTFNVAFLPRAPFSPHLPDYIFRIDRISEILVHQNVDIVVLNELFIPEIRARLIRNLGNTYCVPLWSDDRLFPYASFATWPGHTSSPQSLGQASAPGETGLPKQGEIAQNNHHGQAGPYAPRETTVHGKDTPFVDSGLLFAFRRDRGIICPDPPMFVPWERRGPESASARMGFFHVKVGLTHTASAASIHLVGLHMNPFGRHRDIRSIQLSQLGSFIRQQDDGVPFPLLRLVVGDFNIVGESAEYRATLGGGRLPHSIDLYRIHHPHSPGYTWSSENPLTSFALGDTNLSERLDYMLLNQHPRCRKRLIVNSIDVMKCELNDYEYRYASDHFGLLLDFDVECF